MSCVRAAGGRGCSHPRRAPSGAAMRPRAGTRRRSRGRMRWRACPRSSARRGRWGWSEGFPSKGGRTSWRGRAGRWPTAPGAGAEAGQGRAPGVFRPRRPAAPRGPGPRLGALAAGLVLGALLGPLVLHPPAGGGVLITRDGEMLAGGALARALTAELASNRTPGSPVEIGVSFRARDGGYCRSFQLREEQALAGVACREHDAWRLEVLAPSPAQPPAAGGYRPAATALPPSVARTLDELRAGEALDASAEAAARAHGWGR